MLSGGTSFQKYCNAQPTRQSTSLENLSPKSRAKVCVRRDAANIASTQLLWFVVVSGQVISCATIAMLVITPSPTSEYIQTKESRDFPSFGKCVFRFQSTMYAIFIIYE
jgi:Flp pilus assembly protein TadG